MTISVEEVADYFQRSILVTESGCWLWQGFIGPEGYALYGNKLVYGVVWFLDGRESPIGTDLRHQCKHKHCINPDHILSGTRQENMMDASRDGTLGRCRRVTDEQVTIARRMLSEGIQKSTIARAIGVSPQWMNKLCKGQIKYAQPINSPIQ